MILLIQYILWIFLGVYFGIGFLLMINYRFNKEANQELHDAIHEHLAKKSLSIGPQYNAMYKLFTTAMYVAFLCAWIFIVKFDIFSANE